MAPSASAQRQAPDGGLPLVPRTLVIDVPRQRLETAVGFWAAALGAEPAWPAAADPFVPLVGAASVLEVLVQAVDGPARYHLDVPADDPDAAAARLESLGASRVRWDDDHWVMRDPAGLLLCVVPGDVHAAATAPRRAGQARLDALFVDVEDRWFEAELGFWSEALGSRPVPTSRPETYTSLPGVRGPGGTYTLEVQRLGAGAPRYHVDLSTPDVAAEAARLEGLGASRADEVETWVVLEDPVGNLFCVVPDEDRP